MSGRNDESKVKWKAQKEGERKKETLKLNENIMKKKMNDGDSDDGKLSIVYLRCDCRFMRF